jgi:hypothetical protein
MALLIRWRGRELRKPTEAQRAEIAAPLGRIAGRHMPAELFTPDLTDAIITADAFITYLEDGTLITWPVTESLPPIGDDQQ